MSRAGLCGSCKAEPCCAAAIDAAVAEAVAAVKADIDANWPGASLPRAIAEQTAGYLGGLTACAVVVKQAFARAVLAGDGE